MLKIKSSLLKFENPAKKIKNYYVSILKKTSLVQIYKHKYILMLVIALLFGIVCIIGMHILENNGPSTHRLLSPQLLQKLTIQSNYNIETYTNTNAKLINVIHS